MPDFGQRKALLLAMREYGFTEATHSKEAWDRFTDIVRLYMEPNDRPYLDAAVKGGR